MLKNKLRYNFLSVLSKMAQLRRFFERWATTSIRLWPKRTPTHQSFPPKKTQRFCVVVYVKVNFIHIQHHSFIFHECDVVESFTEDMDRSVARSNSRIFVGLTIEWYQRSVCRQQNICMFFFRTQFKICESIIFLLWICRCLW